MEQPNHFFLGIDKPVEVRLNVLESSKQLIEVLKEIERVKKIKKEKAELVLDLKTKLNNINRLIIKLKKTLPNTKLRNKEVPVKKQIPSKKTTKKKKVEKKPNNEPHTSKLDKELMKIEKQLANLKS